MSLTVTQLPLLTGGFLWLGIESVELPDGSVIRPWLSRQPLYPSEMAQLIQDTATSSNIPVNSVFTLLYIDWDEVEHTVNVPASFLFAFQNNVSFTWDIDNQSDFLPFLNS